MTTKQASKSWGEGERVFGLYRAGQAISALLDAGVR
jgi:hypothetical protein